MLSPAAGDDQKRSDSRMVSFENDLRSASLFRKGLKGFVIRIY